MKHASDFTLDQVEELLRQIRGRNSLKERKRGIFYRSSKAFLHFHDDAAGIFADISGQGGFQRFRVVTSEEQAVFLHVLDASVSKA